MYDYIKEKVPALDVEDNTIDSVSGLLSSSKNVGPSTSNWAFRNLPTPPATTAERRPSPIMKKMPLITPNLASSLRNMPKSVEVEVHTPFNDEINNNVLIEAVDETQEQSRPLPRRTPSIKYIEPPVPSPTPLNPVPIVITPPVPNDVKMSESEDENSTPLNDQTVSESAEDKAMVSSLNEQSSDSESDSTEEEPVQHPLFDNFSFGKIPRAHFNSENEYEDISTRL